MSEKNTQLRTKTKANHQIFQNVVCSQTLAFTDISISLAESSLLLY